MEAKDATRPKCPGSPLFLDWLAKHNQAQGGLDNSNAVMGWASKPNARHGVDCGCMDGPDAKDSEDRGWFNSFFRREGAMPKKAGKLHCAAPGGKRASCGKRMKPGEPRVSGNDDFWAADANGTLCQNCRRAATNEASPF